MKKLNFLLGFGILILTLVINIKLINNSESNTNNSLSSIITTANAEPENGLGNAYDGECKSCTATDPVTGITGSGVTMECHWTGDWTDDCQSSSCSGGFC